MPPLVKEWRRRGWAVAVVAALVVSMLVVGGAPAASNGQGRSMAGR